VLNCGWMGTEKGKIKHGVEKTDENSKLRSTNAWTRLRSIIVLLEGDANAYSNMCDKSCRDDTRHWTTESIQAAGGPRWAFVPVRFAFHAQML
jgi:hypothetical protein